MLVSDMDQRKLGSYKPLMGQIDSRNSNVDVQRGKGGQLKFLSGGQRFLAAPLSMAAGEEI